MGPLTQRYARREGAPVDDPSAAVQESAAFQEAATRVFSALSMPKAFFVHTAASLLIPVVSAAVHRANMACTEA